MRKETRTISLSLPFHMGSVNCHLIETDADYALIGTGGSNGRKELVRGFSVIQHMRKPTWGWEGC
jgi:hypothetical protein